MTRFKTAALCSSAILPAAALFALGLPLPAFAQDTAAQGAGASIPGKEIQTPGAEGAESGDIIVTARKRAEDVQTVPIAITAFTSQDLAERNISNFNDLANATPGVAITSISGGNVQNIYLRGLAPANTANDLNVEANVGVFIDGIYQTSRNTLDIISVLDVGQIEIAKGPQSALYGRSTFAGALGISTRRASKDLEGSVSATVGEDEDYRVRGTISGPLSDTLSARVSAGYLTYDGYGKNAADTKDNLGGTEKYAVSGSLEFAPTDNFTARLAGFYTHSKTEITPLTLLPLASFNCGTTNATPVALGLRQLYCGTLTAQKTSDISTNIPETTAKTRQISLDLNYDFGPASLISVTGYTAANNRAYNDYDGTSAGTLFGVCTLGAACIATPNYTRLVRANLPSSGVERVHTFSQELRLQSDDSSAFSWLIGGNYFDSQIPLVAGGIHTDLGSLAANERLVAVTQLGTPPATGVGAYEFTANPFLASGGAANQVFSSYSDTYTKTSSIFGSLGYKFGDLRVNAEGRYNVDKKHAQVFSVSNPASAPGINQPISGTSTPAAGTFPVAGPIFERKFKSFAPRFSIDYTVSSDIFLYATAAKGVRSGGFNTANAVSATGILASEVAYDEETNWTYEAGFKTNLADNKLLLNASVYHVDWKNAQVSAFTDNPTAVAPVRIVRNIGNIKATGFEAQAEYKFSDMFALGGSLTYSDPKFKAGVYDGGAVTQCVIGVGAAATAAPGCPPVIVITTPSGAVRAVPSLEGLRPQRSVKTQWNAHATVNIPVSDDWRASGRVDVTHTGSAYNNLVNTQSFGKRTLTNLRLGVENEKFSLALFANNLFDKTYAVNSINQPRAGVPFAFGVPEIYLGEGRRVGLTGTAKF